MAQTTTKTSTRTNTLAIIATAAATGLIGFAAAIGLPKIVQPDLTTKVTYLGPSTALSYGDSRTYAVVIDNSGGSLVKSFTVELKSEVSLDSVSTTSSGVTCSLADSTTAECTVKSIGSSTKSFSVVVTNDSETTASCGESRSVALTATMDTKNTIAEKSESNNTATSTAILDGPTDADCVDYSITLNASSDAVEYGALPVANGSLIGFESFATITNESASAVVAKLNVDLDVPEELKIVGFLTDRVDALGCAYSSYGNFIWCDTSYESNPPGDLGSINLILENVATEAQIPCGETKEVEITAEVEVDPTISLRETVEIDNNTDTTTVTLESPC